MPSATRLGLNARHVTAYVTCDSTRAVAEKCHLDFETYSECDLKTAGMYKYAEHLSTEIFCVGYSFDDGPTHLWIPRQSTPMAGGVPLAVFQTVRARLGNDFNFSDGDTCPRPLQEHIERGGCVVAHNAGFERCVANGPAGVKIGFPRLTIEQMRCTAAKARAHGLPGALADVAAALEVPSQKDQKAINDLRYLCKPAVKDGKWFRPTLETDPARFVSVYVYNVADVKAERDVDNALPDLSPREQRVWELDQRINDRGWRVDLDTVAQMEYLIDNYKRELVVHCRAATGVNPTQREKIAEWVRTNGYTKLPDLEAASVEAAVEDPTCPPNVREILKLYSTYGMKAPTKYPAMRRYACRDERLHGMFIYCGAGPGRWSSMMVALQNLFRSVLQDSSGEPEDPQIGIDVCSALDLEWIRAMYPGIDPMKVFASLIRGMLIPGEGRDLQFVDFSSIESRLGAWFAGAEWKLNIFRGDGKIYEAMAAGIYRKQIKDITKDERFRGKVAELACGYHGGWRAVVKMARQFGVKGITEFSARETVDGWHNTNPESVKLWYKLEETAKAAVTNPGSIYKAASGRLMFRTEQHGKWLWLCMRLPSGRKIWYFRPRVDDEGKVRYWGIDTDTRRWCETSTYGGKLLQNANEGTGRDLLVEAMFKFEARGWPCVGSVHDEAITEPLKGDGTLEEAIAMMCDSPEWAGGLPVSADGYRAQRYRK